MNLKLVRQFGAPAIVDQANDLGRAAALRSEPIDRSRRICCEEQAALK
jgi:hypothetical protein